MSKVPKKYHTETAIGGPNFSPRTLTQYSIRNCINLTRKAPPPTDLIQYINRALERGGVSVKCRGQIFYSFGCRLKNHSVECRLGIIFSKVGVECRGESVAPKVQEIFVPTWEKFFVFFSIFWKVGVESRGEF